MNIHTHASIHANVYIYLYNTPALVMRHPTDHPTARASDRPTARPPRVEERAIANRVAYIDSVRLFHTRTNTHSLTMGDP